MKSRLKGHRGQRDMGVRVSVETMAMTEAMKTAKRDVTKATNPTESAVGYQQSGESWNVWLADVVSMRG